MTGDQVPGADTATSTAPGYTNFATDDATVTAQIGVVHGDVRIYQYLGGSAEEQLEVGYRNLQAGIVSEAEKLIGESITRGVVTSRAYFYYALALVSGRSFGQVVQDKLPQLDWVFSQVNNCLRDDFTDGVRAIRLLFESMIDQDGDGREGGDDSAGFSVYDSLPPAIRDDVGRHLEVVLTGALEASMERRENAEIDRRRCDHDRRQRAVKFFVSDPAPPRRRVVLDPPSLVEPILKLAGGLLLIALGWLLLISSLSGVSMWLWLPLLWAVPVSSALLIWGIVGLERARAWDWRNALRRNHFPGFDDDVQQQVLNQPEGDAFARFIEAMYWRAFRRVAPADAESAARWRADTDGVVSALVNETVRTYFEFESAHPDRLGWLICYQAEAVRASWGRGDADPSPSFVSSLWTRRLALVIGGICLIFLFTVWFGLAWHPGDELRCVIAVLVIIVALVIVDRARRKRLVWRIGDWLCRSWDVHIATEEWNRQFEAYRSRLGYLSDRPSDMEMATWLGYDTRFIKNEALKQYGLSNGEVLGHLVLLEAAGNAVRARVPGGPARYSEYLVTLFLLTDSGVRHVQVELDFVNAVLGDQRRMNFRYDSLASVEVVEKGVRFAGRKTRVSPLSGVVIGGEDHSGALIWSQALNLTLVNGQQIRVPVEDYNLWHRVLGSEDREQLLRIASETSGVTMAFRVLEAVAADGREWIARERARSARSIPHNPKRVDAHPVVGWRERGETPTQQASPTS